MNAKHRKWLFELTQLPTAAGCEQRVIDWVKRWTNRRPSVQIRFDQYGNLLLTRKGPRRRQPPIYFTAHMDHPAFVVTQRLNDRIVEANFRGGVEGQFFVKSRVLLHLDAQQAVRGTVLALKPTTATGSTQCVTVRFTRPLPKQVAGCVMTWDTGPAREQKGKLLAPACDDLAGVAAAISAFDALGPGCKHVGVLLTRAEEIGFLGAIGACMSGAIPAKAKLIALECSKSFESSPIGGGPIARVGDRTSTFDPLLTQQLVNLAKQISAKDPSFRSQRCLMPGGTCEATAYQAYGYTAACLCLPLGRYHNMNQDTHRIDSELISLTDYDGLVRWLVATGKYLDNAAGKKSLRIKLDQLFGDRQSLLINTRHAKS